MTEQGITLRVDLDSKTSKKFEAIKEELGLKHNTEVIRSIINDRYSEISQIETEALQQEVKAV